MSDHHPLIQFIQHRIQDKGIIRLITQWLKVGITDDEGHRAKSYIGTPQGAVISPLLANIYLHYSFDLWINKYRKYTMGEIIAVRYADDSVLGFQKHQEAVRCLKALKTRLGKFGLQVHRDKTKLIRFGRFALIQCAEKPSRGKPGTFDFLGFTHYLGRKFNGEVTVKRKTKRSKSVTQLKRIKMELKKRLHDKPSKTGLWLRKVIQGHINYYGVPFNFRAISCFVYEVRRLWFKSLRRRSQRHKMDWRRFDKLSRQFIPTPKIVHPYPEQRFSAKYLR